MAKLVQALARDVPRQIKTPNPDVLNLRYELESALQCRIRISH